MKTNTNTEELRKVIHAQLNLASFDGHQGVPEDYERYEGNILKAIDQYVHQKTIEAQQEIVYQIMRGEHGHDEKSIVESLQASLNTEGEK